MSISCHKDIHEETKNEESESAKFNTEFTYPDYGTILNEIFIATITCETNGARVPVIDFGL